MNKSTILQVFSDFSELKEWSDNTKKSYNSIVKKFIYEKHSDSINNLTKDYLKHYMIEFRKNNSKSYYNKAGWVLKSLFESINQNYKMNWFEPLNIDRKYKSIITFDEFKSIMSNIKSLKQKTITILLYSSGIRISELLNIKLEDMNFENNTILIHSLKHGKDRFVLMHKILLNYIKAYLLKYNPTEYLFNGQFSNKYSDSSIRAFLKRASIDLNKNIYPHLFRSTFATELIDKENVFFTQNQLGHKNLKSTTFYYHPSFEKINNSYNPLDRYKA